MKRKHVYLTTALGECSNILITSLIHQYFLDLSFIAPVQRDSRLHANLFIFFSNLSIRFITDDINSGTCSTGRSGRENRIGAATWREKTQAHGLEAKKMHPARSRPKNRRIATVYITRSPGYCNAGLTFRRRRAASWTRSRIRFSRDRHAATTATGRDAMVSLA